MDSNNYYISNSEFHFESFHEFFTYPNPEHSFDNYASLLAVLTFPRSFFFLSFLECFFSCVRCTMYTCVWHIFYRLLNHSVDVILCIEHITQKESCTKCEEIKDENKCSSHEVESDRWVKCVLFPFLVISLLFIFFFIIFVYFFLIGHLFIFIKYHLIFCVAGLFSDQHWNTKQLHPCMAKSVIEMVKMIIMLDDDDYKCLVWWAFYFIRIHSLFIQFCEIVG